MVQQTIVSDNVAVDTSLGSSIISGAWSAAGLNCDNEAMWNIYHGDHPSSSSGWSNGETTITCTATDTSGNTTTASFTVTIGTADTTPSVNISFDSLNMDSSGGTILAPGGVSPGEIVQITPTVKWEGPVPDNLPFGEPVVHGEIKFPDGTIWESINYSPVDLSIGGTITLSTWNIQLHSMPNGYFGNPWPVGEYTVTFTADTGNTLSETNESDNVITRTFEVTDPQPAEWPATLEIAFRILGSYHPAELYVYETGGSNVYHEDILVMPLWKSTAAWSANHPPPLNFAWYTIVTDDNVVVGQLGQVRSGELQLYNDA